jgi:hypothetical protein
MASVILLDVEGWEVGVDDFTEVSHAGFTALETAGLGYLVLEWGPELVPVTEGSNSATAITLESK